MAAFDDLRDRWERTSVRERRLVVLLGLTGVLCAFGYVGFLISDGLSSIAEKNSKVRAALRTLDENRDEFLAQKTPPRRPGSRPRRRGACPRHVPRGHRQRGRRADPREPGASADRQGKVPRARNRAQAARGQARAARAVPQARRDTFGHGRDPAALRQAAVLGP